MLRPDSKYAWKIIWLQLLLAVLVANIAAAQQKPPVSQEYQKFFVHYVDDRSIPERILNQLGATFKDTGRSFALIAGVAHYPNMSPMDRELKPAAEDIKILQDYLKKYEFFDEIVVLQDGQVTMENLEFFLQKYFPERLKKFPRSRFLFAYSGHGMNTEHTGYLLKSTARNLRDKDNSINVTALKAYIEETVKAGHHVLVLLNACYSGALLERSTPFGGKYQFIPIYRGAHAITAGGSDEISWQNPKVGKGSVFFETIIAGLSDKADDNKNGLVDVFDLFSYVRREVQIFTKQEQNPQLGDLSFRQSKGQFFFLNRDKAMKAVALPEYKPELATAMGIKVEETLKKAAQYYRLGNYKMAFSLIQQAAFEGNAQAMNDVAHCYEKGEGVKQDYAQAVSWYRKGAEAGEAVSMFGLGNMYNAGTGVKQDYAQAVSWYRKAAEAGVAGAMTNLGAKYYYGQGVKQDYAQAVSWLRKGAEAGSAGAMTGLGLMYYEGHAVKQDYAQAVSWYRKGAEAGNVAGMFDLGVMYEAGTGVQRDNGRAISWYRKAAELGDEAAKKRLKELGKE